MNKDQMKGTAENLKGKVNEAVGKATGDKSREMKGDLQQGAGEARKAYGDAKEQANKAAKDLAHEEREDRADRADNPGRDVP